MPSLAMGRPLDGVQAKLERAEHHLKTFHTAIGTTFERDPVVPAVKSDPESGDYIIWVKYVPELPAYLGAILGDFLHNLRSGLNHLAFALVKASGGLTTKNEGVIQFPIYDHLTQFRSKFSELLPGVGPDPIAIIERHQPENRPDLGLLGHLSNDDKHRIPALLISRVMAITPTFRSPDCSHIEAVPVGVYKPLDVGAEVVRLRLSGCGAAQARVQMNGHFIPEVTFEDGREVLSALMFICGQCAIIAKELEPFIEPRPLLTRGRQWPSCSTSPDGDLKGVRSSTA